ncbi:pirin family protein [Corallincola luteus]|uniref:Pirin family protein n=1 Tax=Corallincola luteus TaxID=1775177 RepID=A0ABY2AKJ1_9GAMM|nr:pirin family protein [Corallincola luteus]TCI02589.1 pirin family protein [Corallincola luteus]
MIAIRPANERGHVNLGWLDSRHSFSFGHYYDPQHMGVSALRVINQDIVQPGGGFGTHPHQDMEILSYVLKGTLEHQDSMGHIQRLTAGEFQLMSAGTGISHSEYNGSNTETAEFLQIWIQPDQLGLTPDYQQKKFRGEGMIKVASPDGTEGSLTVHQDATVYLARYAKTTTAQLKLPAGRQGYLQLIKGSIDLEHHQLAAGDGLNVSASHDMQNLIVENAPDSEWLWFDLPMA